RRSRSSKRPGRSRSTGTSRRASTSRCSTTWRTPSMAEQRIVILDCETTGTDRARDQIIEVCIQRGLRGEARTWRTKPTVSIHPDAQAAHGITLEQLEACPPFADVA